MKTIITKAGPPEGNTSQKQQNYESGGKSYSSSNRHNTQDENRFSRYGGNDLGRGIANHLFVLLLIYQLIYFRFKHYSHVIWICFRSYQKTI